MKKNSIVRKLIITFSSITGGLLILVGLILSVGFYRFSHDELVNTLKMFKKKKYGYSNKKGVTI